MAWIPEIANGMLGATRTAAPLRAIAKAPPAAGHRMAADQLSLSADVYARFKLAPNLPVADGPRAATKLSFFMADDEPLIGHQSAASLGATQLLDDVGQANVHNVIFRDGSATDDSQLFYIARGDQKPEALGAAASPLAPGVKEVQSNNPRVLAETLGYTLDHYPGQAKYMEIYTHGGGPFGLGMDAAQTDVAGKPLAAARQITRTALPDFAAGLRQGLAGRKLDLIYFHTCLAGNLETLNEIVGTTRYAVASENVSESVSNSDLYMTRMFDELAGQGVAPDEIARRLAAQGHAESGVLPEGPYASLFPYDVFGLSAGSESGFSTLAAFDVDKVPAVTRAMADLTQTLMRAFPDNQAALVAAYDAVPLVDEAQAQTVGGHQRDLIAFTEAVKQRVSDPAVKAAADRVARATRATMLVEADRFGAAANGLSVYMPRFEELAPTSFTASGAKSTYAELVSLDQGGYARTAFARQTGWPRFLAAVRQAKAAAAKPQ